MRSFGPATTSNPLAIASAKPVKAHSDWETLTRLFPYLWAYKWRVMAALGFMVGAKMAKNHAPRNPHFGRKASPAAVATMSTNTAMA